MSAAKPGARCRIFDSRTQRWCRNKPYMDSVCRKHVIDQLRRYEENNPALRFYLEHRHLLEAPPARR